MEVNGVALQWSSLWVFDRSFMKDIATMLNLATTAQQAI